eukprot:scaffold1435_cov63-Cylindrotheca_fusiformis.AAC.2
MEGIDATHISLYISAFSPPKLQYCCMLTISESEESFNAMLLVLRIKIYCKPKSLNSTSRPPKCIYPASYDQLWHPEKQTSYVVNLIKNQYLLKTQITDQRIQCSHM